jgi:hypothetical protein
VFTLNPYNNYGNCGVFIQHKGFLATPRKVNAGAACGAFHTKFSAVCQEKLEENMTVVFRSSRIPPLHLIVYLTYMPDLIKQYYK